MQRIDRVAIYEEFLWLTQNGTQLQNFTLDRSSVLVDGKASWSLGQEWSLRSNFHTWGLSWGPGGLNIELSQAGRRWYSPAGFSHHWGRGKDTQWHKEVFSFSSTALWPQDSPFLLWTCFLISVLKASWPDGQWGSSPANYVWSSLDRCDGGDLFSASQAVWEEAMGLTWPTGCRLPSSALGHHHPIGFFAMMETFSIYVIQYISHM